MEARQKCPDLYLVPSNYNLYEQSSQALLNLLNEYTNDVEQCSIDEAFMEMSGIEKLFGQLVKIVEKAKIGLPEN